MTKGLLAFRIAGEPRGLTERIRRAIGQADVGVEPIRRLIASVERLKLKPKFPVYLTDAWAHVGIERLKIAIYTKEHLEYGKVAFERRQWEGHGWTLIAISHRQINLMSNEDLTEQLRLALVELGKLKK